MMRYWEYWKSCTPSWEWECASLSWMAALVCNSWLCYSVTKELKP